MLALGKSAPEYKLYTEAVSLTLRSSLEDIEFLRFINKETEENGDFSVSEICILKYVKMNKIISLSKAAEVAQITTQSATNVLNVLVKRKIFFKGKIEIGICLHIGFMNRLMITSNIPKIKILMKFKQKR